jgi:hypothetical protein
MQQGQISPAHDDGLQGYRSNPSRTFRIKYQSLVEIKRHQCSFQEICDPILAVYAARRQFSTNHRNTMLVSTFTRNARSLFSVDFEPGYPDGLAR